jgi:hypothetical protein
MEHIIVYNVKGKSGELELYGKSACGNIVSSLLIVRAALLVTQIN